MHSQYPDDQPSGQPNGGHISDDGIDDDDGDPSTSHRRRIKIVRHPNGTLGMVILQDSSPSAMAPVPDIVFQNRFPDDRDENDVITMGQMINGGAGKEATAPEIEQVIYVNDGDGEQSRLPRGN